MAQLEQLVQLRRFLCTALRLSGEARRRDQQFDLVGMAVARLKLALGIDGKGGVDRLKRIPQGGVLRLLVEQPDVLLLLAWNFKDEILRQQQEYRDRGGRFLVPVPSPEVIS